jgi:fluoroacetyl-CoA thioesterase
MGIAPGLVSEIVHVVATEDTAAHYGSGLVPVLSTPHLIALMESAAQAVVAPYLGEEQTAVGTQIDMQHLAATPVGMEVRVRAELTAVTGRRLEFTVDAWDAVEKIGTARHQRFIIDTRRFMARVASKTGTDSPREGADASVV